MQKNPFYITLSANGAIAARKAVKISSGEAVIAAAETDALIGLNSQLAAADNEHCDIIVGGVAEAIAGGNITEGNAVTADSNGDLVAVTNTMKTTGDVRIIGYALATAVDDDIFPVLVAPGLLTKAPSY